MTAMQLIILNGTLAIICGALTFLITHGKNTRNNKKRFHH